MRFERKSNQQDSGLTTERIEAFSDAVFAIAITLLILEIRLPTQAADIHRSLATELWSIWPSYFAYILSFVMIGIYWVNHHYIFNLYHRTDHVFNLLNVFFLMCVCFLPFPTEILGKHLLDSSEQRTTVAFYIFGLLLPATAWFILWLYASSNYRLIDVRLNPRFVRYLTRQYALSLGFYLLALIFSFIQPMIGLAISVGLTLFYLLPSKQPTYIDPPAL